MTKRERKLFQFLFKVKLLTGFRSEKFSKHMNYKGKKTLKLDIALFLCKNCISDESNYF